jgi:hypothetical protein
MKEELELELVKKYPKIFQHYKGDPRQTCMAWGMTCGDGWYKLIDMLCFKLSHLSDTHGIQTVADQVKEKFGGLRFYYHLEYANDTLSFADKVGSYLWKIERFIGSKLYKYKLIKEWWAITNLRKRYFKSPTEQIEDLISNAEEDSYHICDVCGLPGKVRGGGWVVTLCDAHWEERLNQRNKDLEEGAKLFDELKKKGSYNFTG